jgi:hypothetical protein
MNQQEYIKSLETRIERLVDELAGIDHGKTRILQSRDYSTDLKWVHLRERAVYMVDEPGDHPLDGFVVDHSPDKEGGIEVRGPSIIEVIPWAANAIKIRNGRR